MKRLIIIFVVLGALLLSGCEARQSFVLQSFTGDAQIISGELKIRGIFSYEGPGSMSLEIREPSQISGIRFTYRNGSCFIMYDGVSSELGELGETSVVGRLFDSMLLIGSRQEYQFSKETVLRAEKGNSLVEFLPDISKGSVKEIKSGNLSVKIA